MRVKRWLLVMILGLLATFLGGGVFWSSHPIGLLASITRWILLMRRPDVAGVLILFLGLVLFIWGFRAFNASIMAVIQDDYVGDPLQWLFRHRVLKNGPKVVAVGGGTGLSTLLRSLKRVTSNITAVVTVADEGGSSGRLREEFGILPPGDIRNCLIALADAEPQLANLFQYRFPPGTELAGHSFGNLFITALTGLTGDFQAAVSLSTRVLAVRGRVLPVTLTDVRLRGTRRNGDIVVGEDQFTAGTEPMREVRLDPDNPVPLQDALDAFQDAELVVLGPGSLYSSIIPNLLVPKVADAIRKSPAVKVLVVNIMTQPGETTDHDAADHLQAIIDHAGPGLVDCVIINTRAPNPELSKRYREQGSVMVQPAEERLLKMGVKVIKAPLLTHDGFARHDQGKLLESLTQALFEGAAPRRVRR
jgi:uncharacterized cofD-like protein